MQLKTRFKDEPLYDEFSNKISLTLLEFIKGKKSRKSIHFFDYTNPLEFTIVLLQKRIKTFNPNRIIEFKQLPWEAFSFEKNGFAIDSNAFIPAIHDLNSPEIDISLCLNKDPNQINYDELRYRLLDNIRHEIEHLLQKGVNSVESHRINTPYIIRKSSETTFKYFIISEEIPAMVYGLNLVAKTRNTDFNYEAIKYLYPFIKHKMITLSESELIISTWTKFLNSKTN
jgi:hypothetical protein